MGVDVNLANTQASQLQQYAESLKVAKQNMLSYKTEISVNWVGTETTYIHSGIDKAILQLDSAITQLETITGDIVTTASQIRQEEIAREEAERQARLAAAAAAAEAARIAAAQAAAQSAAQAVAKSSATQQTVSKTNTSKSNSSSSKTNTQKPNSFLSWITSWF